MVRIRKCFAIGIALILWTSACCAAPAERWERGKRYVWQPPRTGSNVGRWVEKAEGGANPQKARAEKKKKQAERAEKKARTKERAAPAPIDNSPPERFR